jgi:hypothetical protein
MISARSFVAGLSASLFFTAAQVQPSDAFRNWDEFARWCLSTNGTPYKASRQFPQPQCIPNQSAPTQQSPPQQQVTTFSQELSAYSDFINRMNREIPGSMAVEAWPASSAELSQRLVKLNDTITYIIKSEYADLDDAVYDRDHVQTIPGEIAAMNKEVNEIQRRNGLMNDYVFMARREYGVLRDYASDQRSRARGWLIYVTPSDLPKMYADNPRFGNASTPPVEIPRAETYVELHRYVARDHHLRAHNVIPGEIVEIGGYSNLNKISFINNGYSSFLSIREQIHAVDRQYDHKLLIEKESKLDELRRQRDEAIYDGQEWLKQVPAVHTNFVVAAVEALAWKTYADHITIPEAMKFYDLNKSWYQLGLTDDKVRQGLQTGKFALSVLSPDAKGVKEFLDVQDRTLGLLGDAQRFMSEAPNIIVNGTPEDMQALLASITNKQSDYYLGVMKDAAQSLGPYPPFAQAVMNGDVPVPYQGIARRLGLTKMLGIGD